MVVKKKETKKQEEKTDKVVLEVSEIVKKLLSLMGVNVQPEVTFVSENNAINVDLSTREEAGLLIGSRGTTLNSLQVIIGMIVRQRLGEWVRILVNVADWREKEEKRLKDLANQAAERAITSEEPQPLYNLTSSQRRIIHLVLSDHKEVTTESHGEGDERYLVVLRKK